MAIAPIVVKCLYTASGGSKEVLCAPIGSKIAKAAAVLSHLRRRKEVSKERSTFGTLAHTLMDQVLLTMFWLSPNWNVRSLHALEESTYTITAGALFDQLWNNQTRNSLCWPELVPQITGGVLPPGLVTVNVSVRQLDLSDAATVLPLSAVWPWLWVNEVAEEVTGPAITNESKSRRNCKKFKHISSVWKH